jgi:hypothetical protein
MIQKHVGLIGLLMLGFTSCNNKEYTCVCGTSGDGPYVYTITASNLDDAQVECAPLGSDCSLLER